ncbi:MAG: hypothetical protein M1819_006510 [Sarea resinae]|nr:MAG: hypothetical protein M1819_006510 [Sarea resinae]
MNQTGVSVSPECIKVFEELKFRKNSLKYIIYKLSDDLKEVVVDQTSEDSNYETFREALEKAKHKESGAEGTGARYAVYNFEYELASGEGSRFVSEVQGEPKFTYAASKDALKSALNGVGKQIEADRPGDLDLDVVLKEVSNGLAKLD